MAMSAVTKLPDLSPELLLEIAGHLKDTPGWHADLRNLSCASSYFRTILSPILFKSITLRNTEKSGCSIDDVGEGGLRYLVREICFEGVAPGVLDHAFGDTEGVLPHIVEDILSNLSRFPKLEKVCTHIVMGSDCCPYEADLLISEETPEQMRHLESTEAWRALITKTYSALARNLDPGFKKLELREPFPVRISVFDTKEFHELLGRMTEFSISCWTVEDSCFAPQTRSSDYIFSQICDELFFDHLCSATDLFVAASFLPVGFCAGGKGLPFSPQQMPMLRSLRVQHVIIDETLRLLLISHAHTLESVRLEHCHAIIPVEPEPPAIFWEDLFTSLAEENPLRLREFSIWPCHGREMFIHRATGQSFLPELLDCQSHHPARIMFPYSLVDQDFEPFNDFISTCDRFHEGEDHDAYIRLMSIVGANCARR